MGSRWIQYGYIPPNLTEPIVSICVHNRNGKHMESIYFKTPKGSETGRKFTALHEKIREAHKAAAEFCESVGGMSYRRVPSFAGGNVGAIVFDKDPDKRLWKKSKEAWTPRLNTREGKLLFGRMDALPGIPSWEINGCIGFNGADLCRIGIKHVEASDYHYFHADPDWGIVPPEDCTEITYTEYSQAKDLA